MKNTLRHAAAALVLITLVLLAACGNKGDLVRPSEADKSAANE
jgi:predicted small lipoprotein YifL